MPDNASLTVNGKPVAADLSDQPGRTLLELLREDLQLTGTKYGCGEGACGACTVLVDGNVTFSCTTPCSEVANKRLTTIEGLANGDALHPVQEAFLAERGFQCGYCTPGMILATVALLKRTPNPTDEDVRSAINGHLCRCCGYEAIARAVKIAAAKTQAARDGEVTR